MKILFLLLLAALLAACQPTAEPTPEPQEPVSSQETPNAVEPPAEENLEIGEAAMVEEVKPMFLESWPLQVHVVISGYLPDGCTTIQKVESRFVNNSFIISISTQRDRDAMCTQALVPFEETHPLNVYGLPAGTYTIEAYGVTEEFTFNQPNVIHNPGGG